MSQQDWEKELKNFSKLFALGSSPRPCFMQPYCSLEYFCNSFCLAVVVNMVHQKSFCVCLKLAINRNQRKLYAKMTVVVQMADVSSF